MRNVFFAIKIDGINDWLSAYPISAFPRFDDPELFFDDTNLFFDKKTRLLNNKDIISDRGSSQSLTQSISPDKDGHSTTTSLTFRIVDYRKFFKDFLSKKGLDDLLGKEVKVFLVSSDDAFPEESRPCLFGYLEDISLESGSVTITVYNVLNYLRSNILPKWQSELVANFEYDSATIQGNRYYARVKDLYSISVVYNSTTGPISVSVLSFSPIIKQIVVSITSSATAKDVARVINDDSSASRLVEVKPEDGNAPQVPFSTPISLSKTKFVKVADVSGLTLGNSDNAFETYILINDEILKVLSINPSTNEIEIDENVRGSFKSFSGVTGSIGDAVSSVYVLRGKPIELFLKLLMSKGNNKSIPVTSYGLVSGVGPVNNAIEIHTDDAYREYGIVIGDIVSLPSVFTNRQVVDVKKTSNLKSYIVVDGPDIGLSATYSGALSHKSKYNTLPVGAGVTSNLVDVRRMDSISNLLFAELPDYEFCIMDDFNFKEFSESELFFPAQLFLCPRNGKISVSHLRPVNDSDELMLLNSDQFINPDRIRLNRSLNDLYYNTVTFNYDLDVIDDVFLATRHSVNTDSVTIYRKNLVPLVINSRGIKKTPVNDLIIEKKSKLILDRYKYGALFFDIELTLRDGLSYEIGDIVLFDGEDIYFPSFDSENYTLGLGFYQVTNREVTFDRVKLTLVSTQYRLDSRYVTFAPSSKVASQSGNTITVLPILPNLLSESEKWRQYIGSTVKFSNEDYTFTHSAKLIDAEFPDILTFDSLVTIPPNCIICPEDYSGDESFNRKIKSFHGSFSLKEQVVSVVSSQTFNVTAGSGVNFYPGLKLVLHTSDWTTEFETTVASVTGDQVTITDVPPTPLATGMLVDVRGFASDKGSYYAWV